MSVFRTDIIMMSFQAFKKLNLSIFASVFSSGTEYSCTSFMLLIVLFPILLISFC